MTPELKQSVIEHAKREYPRECCGLIVEIKNEQHYRPCKNISENQKDFIIDPVDYAFCEDHGKILAVVHSHCDISPKPSQADIAGCERSNLTWHIVGYPMQTWETIEPRGIRIPLLGRVFSHGVHDCYSLIRDWYQENRSVELLDFDRNEEWWLKGDDLYANNFRKAGFEPITDEIQEGDVILMQIMSNVINHAAIYLGGNRMMHHLMKRLSERTVYGGYWAKHTRAVIRYKGSA